VNGDPGFEKLSNAYKRKQRVKLLFYNIVVDERNIKEKNRMEWDKNAWFC